MQPVYVMMLRFSNEALKKSTYSAGGALWQTLSTESFITVASAS